MGAGSGIGKRLETALGFAGRVEETVLLGTPETLAAATTVEEQEKARAEAERPRRGLTRFMDGPRMESGATGYVVAWKKGEQ